MVVDLLARQEVARQVRECTVALIRVLTWNLFHGRAQPPAGRPLLAEFAATLAGWAWDVALLQEVPPWWPPALADAAGAHARWVPTSRHGLLPLRRAIAERHPDLIKSNGGGANALLVRSARGAREVRASSWAHLTRWPERRVVHGVRLTKGPWVVNLHASNLPEGKSVGEGEEALARARRWARGAPLIFGGDLNQTRPQFPGLAHVAAHHVDHLFTEGLSATGPSELLEAGALSDHRPLAVDLR